MPNSANKLLADMVLTRFQEKQPISHLFNSAPVESKSLRSREVEYDDGVAADKIELGSYDNH